MKKPFPFGPQDHIVTAYAEAARGPGWANSPVWVIIQDRQGRLRRECLQPDEQLPEMGLLYGLSQNAHLGMVAQVRALLQKRRSAIR